MRSRRRRSDERPRRPRPSALTHGT
jgi:hypothetical protein